MAEVVIVVETATMAETVMMVENNVTDVRFEPELHLK